MDPIRIMPCLDMNDGRAARGVDFVSLGAAGDPVANAVFYQREGADDLAMLDIAASVFHFRILSIGQVKEYLRGKGCGPQDSQAIGQRRVRTVSQFA